MCFLFFVLPADAKISLIQKWLYLYGGCTCSLQFYYIIWQTDVLIQFSIPVSQMTIANFTKKTEKAFKFYILKTSLISFFARRSSCWGENV